MRIPNRKRLRHFAQVTNLRHQCVGQELQPPRATCLLPKAKRRAWERPPYTGSLKALATYTAI
jgi:hypothetical protein